MKDANKRAHRNLVEIFQQSKRSLSIRRELMYENTQ